MNISILFLMADPTDTTRLRISKELREIKASLRQSNFREEIKLHQRESIRASDITQAILDVSPQIVHFSGHGQQGTGAIIVEDLLGYQKAIDPEALEALFSLLTGTVTCVILNSCYSGVQAEAIAKHVEYVIGMKKEIRDSSAIIFSVGFYKALGAGRSVDVAYEFGLVEMLIEGITEQEAPVLYSKNDNSQQARVQSEEKMTNLGQLMANVHSRIKVLKRDNLNFLLVGKAGVGKSSTVNSLFGRKVAETDAFKPGTTSINLYKTETHSVKYTIYDTPGLGESDNSQEDIDNLERIKSQVEEIDCMLYIAPLDDKRIMGSEKRGFRYITQVFGTEIWNHTVIVFTFANSNRIDDYETSLNTRTKLIRNEIARHANTQIAASVAAVAIDNNSEKRPDGSTWMEALLSSVFVRISENGVLPFILITNERIQSGELDFTEGQEKSIIKRVLAYPLTGGLESDPYPILNLVPFVNVFYAGYRTYLASKDKN